MLALGIQAHILMLVASLLPAVPSLLCTLVLFFKQDLMETGLKLSMYLRNNPECRILLPLPSKYWEYRHRPLHLLYMVLGVEPGASCRLTHTLQPEKELYLKFYAEF